MPKKAKKKYTTLIRCDKCNRTLGYSEKDISQILLCPTCNLGKKYKKKSEKISTASSNFAKVKGGIRKDVHKSYYFRSTTEANVARLFKYFNVKWKFEERSFTFDGYKTKPFVYIMDFEILKIDKRKKPPEWLTEGFIEVKGWMTSSSRQKLRRLYHNYPDDAAKTTIIIYTKYRKKDILFAKRYNYKYVFYDEITKEYSSIIPNWE